MEKPRFTAAGHIVFSALVAATIAFLTAQTKQICWLANNQPLWYGTTALFPIIMAALISSLWHRFGAPWLHRNTFRGWILHSFYKPTAQEIHFDMPTPETTLVIASAASAGAVIALAQQPWVVQTVSATVVGGVTAAAIVFSNPNTGQPLAKGKLDLQTERYYQDLLRRKADTQRRALLHQSHQCADCKSSIREGTRRFAIIDEAQPSHGILTQHDIKAVCKKCAVTQPTTSEIAST